MSDTSTPEEMGYRREPPGERLKEAVLNTTLIPEDLQDIVLNMAQFCEPRGFDVDDVFQALATFSGYCPVGYNRKVEHE